MYKKKNRQMEGEERLLKNRQTTCCENRFKQTTRWQRPSLSVFIWCHGNTFFFHVITSFYIVMKPGNQQKPLNHHLKCFKVDSQAMSVVSDMVPLWSFCKCNVMEDVVKIGLPKLCSWCCFEFLLCWLITLMLLFFPTADVCWWVVFFWPYSTYSG